jgi:hypothetical protein
LFKTCRLMAFSVVSPLFAFLSFAFLSFAFSTSARAAEIVLERSGVEKLVAQALFKDRGRLVLASGPCSSYMDQPSVALANGRVQIRSHLLARVGVVVNGDCAGLALKSWTKVSGRPVAAGGAVRLEDIRIDEVDDPDTRAVLANTGLIRAMPKAVTLDVQGAVQSMLTQSIDQIQASIENFDFQDVAVVGDRLSMKFEFRLVGR